MAYSSKPYGPGLTDHMRAVVTAFGVDNGQWTTDGLAKVFRAQYTDGNISYYGATGDLTFDDVTNTKILNTNYMVWTTDRDYIGNDITRKVIPICYLSTAATPYETSKADVHNSELGVFLSNAFARTFRQYVNQNNAISLRDLYIELARTTNGSHVSIYNDLNYGSVYTNNMSDYFPE